MPAFPISDPHWLAGMTRRKVTGGLETLPPFAGAAQRSWGRETVSQPYTPLLPSRPPSSTFLKRHKESTSSLDLLQENMALGLTFPSPIATIWRQGQVSHRQPPSDSHPLDTNLIQLEGDHGDCMENSSCRPSDGGDPLRAGALRDGYPGTALQVWDKRWAAGIFPAVVPGICLPAPLTRP